MLNLQFAETMELTEAGGDLVYLGNIPSGAWGGFGTPWSITNFWEKNFNHDSSTVNRRH